LYNIRYYYNKFRIISFLDECNFSIISESWFMMKLSSLDINHINCYVLYVTQYSRRIYSLDILTGEIAIEVTGVVGASPALWYFRYIASIFLTLHKRLWLTLPVFYIFLPSTPPYWQIILRFCWQWTPKRQQSESRSRATYFRLSVVLGFYSYALFLAFSYALFLALFAYQEALKFSFILSVIFWRLVMFLVFSNYIW
jgi:hypothetical protein